MVRFKSRGKARETYCTRPEYFEKVLFNIQDFVEILKIDGK